LAAPQEAGEWCLVLSLAGESNTTVLRCAWRLQRARLP
jgi:hypothetical protein